MSTLLYLHGFGGSPDSYKAKILRTFIDEQYPKVQLLVPALPNDPAVVEDLLEKTIKGLSDPVGIIGTSLGGFYGTWASQHFSIPAVVFNPLVEPATFLWPSLGKEYRMNDGSLARLTKYYLHTFAKMQLTGLTTPGLIWLLVQEGDSLLPYERAVRYYRHCRQTIEKNGSHDFIGFEKYLSDIMAFLGLENSNN